MNVKVGLRTEKYLLVEFHNGGGPTIKRDMEQSSILIE